MREPIISRTPKTVDLQVVPNGTITTIYTLTAAARDWVEANVEIEDWQCLGDLGFCCEPRYAAELLEHAATEGLVLG